MHDLETTLDDLKEERRWLVEAMQTYSHHPSQAQMAPLVAVQAAIAAVKAVIAEDQEK